MPQVEFLQQLNEQLQKKLPFVGYRKPDESNLMGLLQSNSDVFSSSNFSESGFVFSPFDSSRKNVLIPSEISEVIEASFESQNLSIKSHKSKVEIGGVDDLKANHINLVEKGMLAIKDNQFKKVVLSRVETVQISEENPIAIFTDLLQLYPSAFVYVWYHPKVGLWLGATPETLLKVKGLRFNTMALAGTQPYIDTEDIVWDKKNLTEQKLVVNFIEEELETVVDTFYVSPPQTIRAGNLLHIKSDISGVLKSDTKNLQHLIGSLHPTPAVCGLPKNEAKEFIIKNEGYEREFYAGFLGELNTVKTNSRNTNHRNVENNAYAAVTKQSYLYVNLRCMQLKNYQAHIYIGGGITKASIPEKEWEETVNKAQTMLKVFGG